MWNDVLGYTSPIISAISYERDIVINTIFFFIINYLQTELNLNFNFIRLIQSETLAIEEVREWKQFIKLTPTTLKLKQTK